VPGDRVTAVRQQLESEPSLGVVRLGLNRQLELEQLVDEASLSLFGLGKSFAVLGSAEWWQLNREPARKAWLALLAGWDDPVALGQFGALAPCPACTRGLGRREVAAVLGHRLQGARRRVEAEGHPAMATPEGLELYELMAALAYKSAHIFPSDLSVMTFLAPAAGFGRLTVAMARFARIMARLSLALVAGGTLLAVAVVSVVYSGARAFHDVATATEVPLPNPQAEPAVPSVVYAANGSVLAVLRSAFNRQPVPLSQIAPVLVSAVLDTEDHNFWVHGAVDVSSVARALLADVSAGSAVQGGSTITQQLVKNIYLSDQKTLTRKIREAVLAERLQEHYTKAQVLDAYLNTIYLGNGAYGVEAAAQEYFGVHASQLDLAQAALLAGLIQAPSGYDPILNPLGARERRAEVLARMVHYGSVTPAEAAAANEVPLPTVVHEPPGISYTTKGYYVDQVVNELLDNPALGATESERVGTLFSGGLKIYTNEVPSLQAYAEKVATEDIPPTLPHVVAAFAVIDPKNGNVEALVGGPQGQQFDDAVQGLRQPGSGFKLFTLVGALEEGYNVYDSILAASPCAINFPAVLPEFGYSLQHPLHNDPGDPSGAVTLVQATALSINCAYLRLAHEVGLQKVVDVARSMGVTDPTLNPRNPSLVIGSEAVRPIEMAAAYATVADGGVYHAPAFVNRVVGPTGSIIYNGETAGRRVFSQQVAEEAIVALRATVQYGTGVAAKLANADVAGKTGTTENSVDAWFNGITPRLVSSVWMGNPSGEVPMYVSGSEVFGAQYPTEIWHDVMAYALKDAPYSAFPAPDPALMPRVKYINSPSLERDDLIYHGWPPPPPPSPPTTAAPKPRLPTRVPTPKAPATVAPTPKAPATVAPTPKAPATVAPTPKAPATVAPTPKAPAAALPKSEPAFGKKPGPSLPPALPGKAPRNLR
jgi:membrane peptidoglycan carboxypeptidase